MFTHNRMNNEIEGQALSEIYIIQKGELNSLDRLQNLFPSD